MIKLWVDFRYTFENVEEQHDSTRTNNNRKKGTTDLKSFDQINYKRYHQR